MLFPPSEIEAGFILLVSLRGVPIILGPWYGYSICRSEERELSRRRHCQVPPKCRSFLASAPLNLFQRRGLDMPHNLLAL